MALNLTGLVAVGLALVIAVLVSQGLLEIDVFLQALGVVSPPVATGVVGYQLRGRQESGERGSPDIGGNRS